MTDFPKLELERWHIEIQNTTRHAYINKWGLDKYYQAILKLSASEDAGANPKSIEEKDSGSFAEPARLMGQCIEMASENKSRQLIPTFWSLIRKNQLILTPIFYPEFFWSIRHFTVILALINIFRKHGAKETMFQIWEYLGWKLSCWFSSVETSTLPEYISLRKVLRKNLLQEISSDNSAMASLRKGR